jgi:hypothetical protein
MIVSIGGIRAAWPVEALEVSYVGVVFVFIRRGSVASILIPTLFTLEKRVLRIMTDCYLDSQGRIWCSLWLTGRDVKLLGEQDI